MCQFAQTIKDIQVTFKRGKRIWEGVEIKRLLSKKLIESDITALDARSYRGIELLNVESKMI